MDGLFAGVPLAVKILVPALAVSFMALEWGTAKLLDHHETQSKGNRGIADDCRAA
jgi:hypothetical protein